MEKQKTGGDEAKIRHLLSPNESVSGSRKRRLHLIELSAEQASQKLGNNTYYCQDYWLALFLLFVCFIPSQLIFISSSFIYHYYCYYY